MTASNLPPVLLVEDSADDIEFARRAFSRAGVANPLEVADEGEAAWEWLATQRESPAAAGPLSPALVLLDLNIPGLCGRDLLRRIKSDERLRRVPVVVLTTSSHRADVDECYELGANSYHRKPNDFREYQETIRRILDYWLSAIEPPGRPKQMRHAVATRDGKRGTD